MMVRNQGTVSLANDGTYGTESLWVFNWYQPHNNNGAPDDNIFKKLGWEMFGYKGIEGFYIYRSNLSTTDLDAIKKISGDNTMTWDKYKKMRFDEVEKNLNGFKYIDTDVAIRQFKEAFIEDSKTGEFNKSANLKRIYHQIIKKKTNDYTDGDSTYQNTPVTVNTAKELVDAINKNIYGIYVLGNNISFADIEKLSSGNYYMEKFVGVIDGKGHSITGVKYPLFNNAKFASINNVTIDGVNYNNDTKAIVALNSANVVLSDIIVNNLDYSIPYTRSTSGAYYEYGCDIQGAQEPISSVEELLSVVSKDDGLFKKYYLTKDIDFTDKSISTNFVIPGIFSGTLDGNNCKITGLSKPLFEKLEKASIKNIIIQDAKITGRSVLADQITVESKISKVDIVGTMLTVNRNDAGIFAAAMNGKSVIEKSSVKGFKITGQGSNVAGVIGSINGSSVITDCYVEGTFENTGNNTGGVVGYGNGDSMIKDSIVKVVLNNNSTDNAGGILGEIYWAQSGQSCFVKNVLCLADGIRGNVIVNNRGQQWKDLRGSSSNNYVLNDTNLSAYTNATTAIDRTEINESFFRDRQKLRDDIWNLKGKNIGDLPVIK